MDLSYLVPSLCPLCTYTHPAEAGAKMPREHESKLFSLVMPHRRRTPGSPWRSRRFRETWLICMQYFLPISSVPLSLHSASLPAFSPLPSSCLASLSNSQLSDWEMAGETWVFCLGRGKEKDEGLQTHSLSWTHAHMLMQMCMSTHVWSAPANLYKTCIL